LSWLVVSSPRRPIRGAIIDAFTQLWLRHLDHRAGQRAGRVVIAAVPAGIAHSLDLGFIQMGKLVLLLLRLEAQFVDQLQRIA
jgi:hypothetical protein